jgi:LPS sulfotransferase NodH
MSRVKFVVLTSSRTGSTWLIDLLNRQPGVVAHGELFLDEPRTSPALSSRPDHERFIEVHAYAGIARPRRVFSYLQSLYDPPKTVGFKLMYGQLRRYPEVLAYLAFHRVRIVHLVRCNHVDVIISEELAKLTGASHVLAGTKYDSPKVYLDPSTLVGRLRKRDKRPAQVRRLARLTGCPYLEVTYEALLDGEMEFTRIARFLDAQNPATELKSSLAKRGNQSHRDAISNYDEVSRLLSSTPFAAMLR